MLDASGKDLTEILTEQRLAAIAQTIPKRTAQDLAKHARKPIEAMVARAEDLLSGAVEQSIRNAEDMAQGILGGELKRLKALAAVNDQVRQSEIEYYENCLVDTKAYLANTKLRLDAIRVALST